MREKLRTLHLHNVIHRDNIICDLSRIMKHYILGFVRYYDLVSKYPGLSFVRDQLLVQSRQLVTDRLTVDSYVLNQCCRVGAEIKYQRLPKTAVNSRRKPNLTTSKHQHHYALTCYNVIKLQIDCRKNTIVVVVIINSCFTYVTSILSLEVHNQI